MRPSPLARAVSAAVDTAAAFGLKVDEATVLHESNRIAVRLLPCAVLARVAPLAHRAGAEFEVAVARRLAGTDALVAGLEPRSEPRVHVRDGFAVTLWRYHEPVPPRDVAPAEYARALARLHEGMRRIDLPVPHFTDRVAQAQRLLDDAERTPELDDAGRALLGGALRRLVRAVGERGAEQQPLHGEPHPGNVLRTAEGVLLVDLETCCLGPVEFDIAHAPEPVGDHYPRADPVLLGQCRTLGLAMAATWRWDREDRLPNGRVLGVQWLDRVRAALARDRAGAAVPPARSRRA